MDTYTKYQQLAVKVCCINYKGSGCLFQPATKEFSYVLTAKHCLEGTDETPQCFDETNIKILLSNNKEKELSVIDFYLHPKYDLAIIRVKYFEGIPSTLMSIATENQPVGLFGFPDILGESDTGVVGHHLKGTINFIYHDKNLIEFNPNTDPSNIINSLNETIEGFSGSGIYIENNNDLYLVGIFTELKEENGAFKGLWGYDIKLFNEILIDNHLPLLIPEELLQFDNYIQTAFESNEGRIKPVLVKNANKILNLQPIHIIESLRERLYLPYDSFVEGELLNPKLWEGWASLLTYYYMDTENVPDKDNINIERKVDDNTQNIKMFFTEHKRLSKCIMYLFVHNYEDLKKNDLIVINTKDSNPGTKRCNNKKTQRVLRNIDSGEMDKLIENGIDIDNPEHLKNVEFIHIDLFTEKFAAFDDIDNITKLEECLKNSINEVFNNVP